MAAVLTQDAVLRFIQSSGGSVKNSDLLSHFRGFIRDHADRDRNRELFKKFVNSVATVRQEDGASVVVLRKQFRGGGVSANPPKANESSNLVWAAEKRRPKPQLEQSGTPAPAGGAAWRAALPAAGIVTNNNVETKLKGKQSDPPLLPGTSAAAQALGRITATAPLQEPSVPERPAQDQGTSRGQKRAACGPLHGATPVTPVRHHGETSPVVPELPVPQTHKAREDRVQPEGRLHVRLDAEVTPVHFRYRPSYKSAMSCDEEEEELPVRLSSGGAVWPVSDPLRDTARTSAAAQALGRITATAPLQEPSVPERPAQDQGTSGGQKRAACGPLHGATPVTPVRHHGETSPLVPVVPELPVPQTHKAREDRVQPEGRLHVRLDAEVTPVHFRYRPSYKSAMSCDEDEEEEEEELPVRGGGAVWPVSDPLRDTARTFSTSSPGITHPAPPSVIPTSSSSAEKQAPKIFIQDVEWETLASPESGLEAFFFPGGSASISPSLPLDAQRHRPSPDPAPPQVVRCRPPAGQAPVEPMQGLRQDQRVRLSPGLSGISPLTSDASFSSSDWPPSGSSEQSGWNSSHKDPQAKTTAETVPQIEDLLERARGTALGATASPWQQSAAETGQVPQIQNLPQRAQGTKVQPSDSLLTASAWHHCTGSLHDNQLSAARALCLSTGDLLDDRDEVQSSDGSTSTPRLRQHLRQPSMLSWNARRRMCHSLGTDLDRIDQEDVRGSEVARLNRLHLISSSLSLRGNLSWSSLSSCSTPPRCHSLVELDERPEHSAGRTSLPVPNPSRASASSSTSHQEAHVGHVRQALVPLESREHKWYVKAAAGAWPDIYSLFRDDPSLLNKQDFISGFSVLHWIAKHGDHRVLNTLWYGVQKVGLAFDVNARSLCGYTPLHIAAIHGSKNIMRLLIKNFSADVKLRDLAGKRPWQYLSGSMTPDIFQLLGAPARAALQETNLLDQPQQQQQQQQRRRRHHLSTASSGERPSIVAGLSKVKRSTSLAAFLKHKSLLPFHGQQSGAVV